MEKISLGLLDLFAYIVPGGVGMMIVYSLNYIHIQDEHLLSILCKLFTCEHAYKDFQLILLIFLAYTAGMTTGMVIKAILWLKREVCKILNLNRSNSRSVQYCYVREHCIENYKRIEQMNVAKEMCRNMGLTVLVGGLLFFYRACNYNCCYLMVGTLLGLLFFCASRYFYKMVNRDLNNLCWPPIW